jgi:hypothetical protein
LHLDDETFKKVSQNGSVSLGGITQDHEQNDFEFYDDQNNQIWINLAGFGKAPQDEDAPRPTEARPGSLLCTYAQTFSDNSRDRDDARSSGARLATATKWLTGILVFGIAAFLIES